MIESNIANNATEDLQIDTGITGNLYAYSKNRYVVKAFCRLIRKSPNNVFLNVKHKVYFCRIKSEYHRKRVKMYQDGILQFAIDF